MKARLRPCAEISRRIRISRPSGALDRRLHQRAIGAGPDEVGHRAAAQEEADGFHEDRLAGAGLTCQYGEARAELQFELVDDGEALDAEVSNHRMVAESGRRGAANKRQNSIVGVNWAWRATERLNNRELPRYHTFDSYYRAC